MYLKGLSFRIISILISLLAILLILELLSRFLIDFKMDYYSSYGSLQKKSNINFIEHPYGKILINKDGFYDDEFNFKNNKQKIAYFGDSVTYGVGAGHGYRFTEYLDELNPNYDHLNITTGIGSSLLNWTADVEEYLLKKNVKRVVYVMNLNDIAPISNNVIKKKYGDELKNIQFINSVVKPIDKILRGKSMLYTYSRFQTKKFLVRRGFESSGFKALELEPLKNSNKQHYINTAKAINDWAKSLQMKGFSTCMVILPYEMQISDKAKNYYNSIGIKFDEGFENFLTQKIIKNNILANVELLIISEGFIENNIGYYYVFNKGDKIDFNHPNREGHLVIAKEINKNKICQK